MVIVGGLPPETYERLSAAILAVAIEPLWSWAVAEGLAERDDFSGDEIRDMLLDWSAALTAHEAAATCRAVSGA